MRASPLAGVVEQVADHLVEIFALNAHRQIVRYAYVDGDSTLGIETMQRPRQSVRRFLDRTVRSCDCARRRGARMGEVIIDLPSHAIDLLLNGGGNLGLARCPRPLRLVRNDGERRLQAVRQVARLRDRTADGLLSLVEQRVEIVDERLHFCRVLAVDAPIAPLVQSGKTAREGC